MNEYYNNVVSNILDDIVPLASNQSRASLASIAVDKITIAKAQLAFDSVQSVILADVLRAVYMLGMKDALARIGKDE